MYTTILTLYKQGLSQRKIAKTTNTHRKTVKKIGSSAFLMGKFIQSSRNPLNPSKVFEKATHY